MSRVQLGSSAAAINLAAMSSMFGRPAAGTQPPPTYQMVGADVDGDGDEDKVAIQRMPLTGVDGKDIAAGATVDITIEPLRMSKVLNFEVDDDIAENLLLTAFEVGQENQFPAKGAIPFSSFKTTATDKAIDTPWAGPGVPLTISIKNRGTSTVTFYGSARVAAIVG